MATIPSEYLNMQLSIFYQFVSFTTSNVYRLKVFNMFRTFETLSEFPRKCNSTYVQPAHFHTVDGNLSAWCGTRIAVQQHPRCRMTINVKNRNFNDVMNLKGKITKYEI